MKRKIIKLTESDLTKIVKRVIAEQEQSVPRSTKGSLIDIAKKEASNKPQLTGYKWTQNPEYIWEIIRHKLWFLFLENKQYSSRTRLEHIFLAHHYCMLDPSTNIDAPVPSHCEPRTSLNSLKQLRCASIGYQRCCITL